MSPTITDNVNAPGSPIPTAAQHNSVSGFLVPQTPAITAEAGHTR